MFYKEEKTIDELFEEAYNACDAIDINEVSMEGFTEYCENLYNIKTDKFLEWFKKRNYEGNVDIQMWAIYAQNKLDNNDEE